MKNFTLPVAFFLEAVNSRFFCPAPLSAFVEVTLTSVLELELFSD
jgi:hypothetical protein